jgi:hypothetical protein
MRIAIYGTTGWAGCSAAGWRWRGEVVFRARRVLERCGVTGSARLPDGNGRSC